MRRRVPVQPLSPGPNNAVRARECMQSSSSSSSRSGSAGKANTRTNGCKGQRRQSAPSVPSCTQSTQQTVHTRRQDFSAFDLWARNSTIGRQISVAVVESALSYLAVEKARPAVVTQKPPSQASFLHAKVSQPKVSPAATANISAGQPQRSASLEDLRSLEFFDQKLPGCSSHQRVGQRLRRAALVPSCNHCTEERLNGLCTWRCYLPTKG